MASHMIVSTCQAGMPAAFVKGQYAFTALLKDGMPSQFRVFCLLLGPIHAALCRGVWWSVCCRPMLYHGLQTLVHVTAIQCAVLQWCHMLCEPLVCMLVVGLVQSTCTSEEGVAV
jgi:hypothetical protein